MYNQDPKKKKLEKGLKSVSHDLNNLFHNILSGIELLKDKFQQSDQIFGIIKNIEQNTLLASDILNQNTNPNSSHLTEKSVINLKQIILETVEIVGRDNKNLILLEGLNKDHYIWGNFTDIKRILINLIKNAREAVRTNSAVSITLDSTLGVNNQELSRITISDNGSGISKDNIGKLFDGEFTTKSKIEGRGLGLSIVKNIIDDHSGFISVKSEVGEGTIFEITFPSYKKADAEKNIENKKVIIAEDDEFQREVLKDLLKSLKLKVFTASNGIEALELYASTKPDLLFIDDNMPGMTGLECTEKIKELENTSPIVLLTGSNYHNEKLNGNISKVLKKPYNFEILESTIKELL